jgi:hypothetical protein
MSLSSTQIDHRRRTFRIDHEPTCDRCGHGASLHTLDTRYPCIGCGERASIGLSGRPVCVGFASAWFDNSTRRAAARTR